MLYAYVVIFVLLRPDVFVCSFDNTDMDWTRCLYGKAFHRYVSSHAMQNGYSRLTLLETYSYNLARVCL